MTYRGININIDQETHYMYDCDHSVFTKILHSRLLLRHFLKLAFLVFGCVWFGGCNRSPSNITRLSGWAPATPQNWVLRSHDQLKELESASINANCGALFIFQRVNTSYIQDPLVSVTGGHLPIGAILRAKWIDADTGKVVAEIEGQQGIAPGKPDELIAYRRDGKTVGLYSQSALERPTNSINECSILCVYISIANVDRDVVIDVKPALSESK